MKNIDEQNQKEKPGFLININPEKIRKLDVRPILDTGKDPFSDIMSFIKEIKKDEIFLLVNSFEPVPLYTVLGKQGYEHYTENKEGLIEVYFYKSVPGLTSNISQTNNEEENKLHDDITNVIEIDVRDLEPPEPMVKILEMLDKVDEKSMLLVHHHREPMMLYPKLEERGYSAVANKIEENYYKVVITKNRES